MRNRSLAQNGDATRPRDQVGIKIHTEWIWLCPGRYTPYKLPWTVSKSIETIGSNPWSHLSHRNMGVSIIMGLPLVIIHFYMGFSLINHTF